MIKNTETHQTDTRNLGLSVCCENEEGCGRHPEQR